MKKLFYLLLVIVSFCSITKSSNAQIVINEVQPDAGNNDGSGGEWLELKNTGAASVDLSCWAVSNGGNMEVLIPNGLILPAGGHLLIARSSLSMCGTCDYPSLNTMFTLNANGFGPGSGAYANTILLNTDPSASGGCGCMQGAGALNNSPLGDRIVVFNELGAVQDAVMFGLGDNYGTGALVSNLSNSSCPLTINTIPATTDPIYTGKTVCNDISGCNSSYSRLPDGNNTVTWSQTGNLACTGCITSCGANTNTASTDQPTPGLNNSTVAFTSTFNSNPVNTIVTNLTVCGAAPLTFTYEVNNFTNTALTAIQAATGNLGSYTRTNGGAATNFTTANFNIATGITTLSSNVIPNTGYNSYEFVWGDGITSASGPGSTSLNTPNNLSSTAKECFTYRRVNVTREDVLTGAPTITCTTPGSITVGGMTGTNIQYTLQKQTVAAGPFTTIVNAQSGNSFSGIIDDNADPLLPNYQVVITSINTVCPNPAAIIGVVPTSCLGNPPCPVYVIAGAGAPTFTPPAPATVCKGDAINFTVDINGTCANGQVEIMYDYNTAFDPYAAGTSLGITNTTVGIAPAGVLNPKVYISEFQPRPCNVSPCFGDAQNPNSGEFVELYNPGPGVADIGGYVVSDGDWAATIPAGTLLAANDYYVISGGGLFCYSGVTPDLNIETCNCTTLNLGGQDIMNLTNSAEQVALFSCSGTFLDGVLWGGGQSLPTVGQTAPATGCNNYIPSKNVDLPAAASFNNSGGSFSGAVGGRQRNAAGAFTINSNNLCTAATFTGTPGAINTGLATMWDGSTVIAGTSCPAPPVSANISITMPDTCNTAGPIDITLKAIFKPAPSAPCLPAAVTALATYTIPSCPMITLTGGGDFCIPDPIPLTLTSSTPLIGNYDINLSNGVNTVTLSNQTGAGPFLTNVLFDGIWQITSITPAVGNTNCEPDFQGSAEVVYVAKPVVNSVPLTTNACYGINFDLSSLHSLITTTPASNNFVWYDVPAGGTPISTLLNITAPVTLYVAASSGLPANCEGLRVPINIGVDPIPNIPTITCSGNSITFVQPSPACIPANCSGLEYSANGINWSAGPTFTAADPGFLGFGSPTNYTLYMRNTGNNQCFNYVTYISSCINFPLPSFIKNFYGKVENEKQVNLIWDIVNEYFVDKYEVEKSRDGLNFEKIGEEKAIATNQSEEIQYNKIDYNPYYGKNYYRLKVLDIDGQYTYSKIILVQFGKGKTALQAIYPNPATDVLYLDISLLSKENITLEILNPLGQTIYNAKKLLDAGSNTISLNTSFLANGNYTIRLKTKTESITQQFIKH